LSRTNTEAVRGKVSKWFGSEGLAVLDRRNSVGFEEMGYLPSPIEPEVERVPLRRERKQELRDLGPDFRSRGLRLCIERGAARLRNADTDTMVILKCNRIRSRGAAAHLPGCTRRVTRRASEARASISHRPKRWRSRAAEQNEMGVDHYALRLSISSFRQAVLTKRARTYDWSAHH